MNTSRQRWGLSLLIAVVLVLGLSQVLDRRASVPVDAGFERALVTFAVVRGINAVISVVQGTQLAIEPAGIGVVLAPGEVFDPVNDLIERFSWIMLLASTSLGAQKVLLDVGVALVMQGALVLALAVLLARLWQPRWWGNGWPGVARVLVRLAWLVLFIRFAAPLVALANDAVYQAFLEPRYQQSQLALEQTRDAVEELQQSEAAQVSEGSGSLLERVGRWYDQTTRQLDVEERIDAYQDRLSTASEHIIHLIVVFLLQTVAFPLLFLWLGLRLLRALIAGGAHRVE